MAAVRGQGEAMDHEDHLDLIRGGLEGGGQVWADFGAGGGAFTLALADLLPAGSRIYAVDVDEAALQANARAMRARFPEAQVTYLRGDFTGTLRLPALDGLLMANALHFQRDAASALAAVLSHLRPGGRMVLVEYNVERGNPAVPNPVPYRRWVELATAAGFATTELLHRRPSRFLSEIYSAVSR